MIRRAILTLCVCALIGSLAGCAADTDAEITNKMSKEDRKALPPPMQILVYDFAVNRSEVSSDSAAADELKGAGDDPNKNAQHMQLEHQITGIVAEKLVEQLHELKLPAIRWSGPPPAGPGIYVIEGQFVTIDEGNMAMRIIIGFGAGGTEIKSLVQVYASEPTGKRLLAEAEVSAESSTAPGLAATLPIGSAVSGVGMAVAVSTGVGVVREINTDVRNGATDTAKAIVKLMEPRLEKLGWIED